MSVREDWNIGREQWRVRYEDADLCHHFAREVAVLLPGVAHSWVCAPAPMLLKERIALIDDLHISASGCLHAGFHNSKVASDIGTSCLSKQTR